MTKKKDENTLLAEERTVWASERSRLANERTFLAWTRTGLATVAGGLAIIRFIEFHSYVTNIGSYILGTLLVFLGMSMFAMSYYDYIQTSKKLGLETKAAGSHPSVTAITFILIFICIALMALIFVFSHHIKSAG